MTQNKAALLELLEKAKGPSADLNARIARAAGWRRRLNGLASDWINPDGHCVGLPYFTSSIDAALTLFKDEREAVEALRGASGIFNPPYMSMWRVKRSLIIAALKAKDSQ